ncbi:hypothetical protein I5907_02935 [Panacibacter sp. DH6]|uniref:Uncharacterized protein n=1 Tax=Panacibacter microcysteis TaxID=2793269 RepID=A0A931E4U1_9BACT|nr:hypothetical protein [Panacibacter microcysteis]MBG9375169.1 hypothetical protein [Panacibacter microcysteis]
MITRHNYEEFFLMYVDDELTTEERAAVELFASQNPDLLPELEMLNQTKLPVDESQVFMHKNELLQKINSIGADNYEEQFLLYVDNELSNDSKNDVEKFVLQNPQFQDEFTLLKQTKLEAETIIFKDKDTLLRKDRDGSIIPLFIRFAIAAAVAGVIALLWWSAGGNAEIANNQVAQNIDSVTTDRVDDIAAGGKKQNNTLPEVVVAPQQPEQKNETVFADKQATHNSVKTKTTAGNKNALENNVAAVKRNDQVAVVAVKKPVETTITQPVENTDITSTDKPGYAVAKNNTKQDNDNNVVTAKNTKPETSKNYVSHAVYKELNTDEDENREALYVGSLQINKNKVRGLVKKVGGLFAGKAKEAAASEDGKLQIANLELNTN